jgi:hypothetical protein
MNLYRVTINNSIDFVGYEKIDSSPFDLSITDGFFTHRGMDTNFNMDIDLDNYVYTRLVNHIVVELKERIKMENRSKRIKSILNNGI